MRELISTSKKKVFVCGVGGGGGTQAENGSSNRPTSLLASGGKAIKNTKNISGGYGGEEPGLSESLGGVSLNTAL